MCLVAVGLGLIGAAPAAAQITAPVTVDGPASEILDFGGVAMASDGGGGLIYVKSVAGVPHIFASRFVGGNWTPPLRVDRGGRFPASQARLSAGPGGELLAVWVTEINTVHSKIRDALMAARLGPQATGFGPAELVDPNVGDGTGVDPSISSTAPGQAIVAYRVITFKFEPNEFSTAVQLRPGDVLAEFRLARLNGNRWTGIGAVNRNPEASTRPPSPTDGPRVVTAGEGSAAVAWQEPDQTGTARILLRRVFGSTLGPVLEASPTTWEGKPVTADVDAFSLAESPLAQVRVAMRVAGTAGSPLAGRLLMNALPPSRSLTAGVLTGAVLADGGSGPLPGGVGPPTVAAVDEGGSEGSMRLSFLAGGRLQQIAVNSAGALQPLPIGGGLLGEAGATTVTAVDGEGGGLSAYPATDSLGRPGVAIRQELPTGAVQSGLVFGAQGGPVAELSIGRSGLGDGLIAFRQGEVGRYEIVADRVSAPLPSFKVKVPQAWVRPTKAMVRWPALASGVGGVRYSVLIDGSVVKRLRGHVFRPPAAILGSGVRKVRVAATDLLGQESVTKAVLLRVDAEPPAIVVKPGPHGVTVSVRDADSGLRKRKTTVSFGEGTTDSGGSRFAHRYAHGGRYPLVVHAVDRVGNAVSSQLRVSVR